jgi:Na+/H+ antiporter NhaC
MANEELVLEGEQKKGSFLGVVPVICLMALLLIPGLISGNFNLIPSGLILLATSLLAIVFKKKGDKATLDERVEVYCKEAGSPMLILMIMIFLLSGGFSGITRGMGTIDSISNFGLSVLPSSMILVTLFLICNLISFASGTSTGAFVVMLPLALDIHAKTNIPLPLLLGVLIGGGLFGDNLSFISDTTIITTRCLDIDNRAKFIENIWLVIPAYILTFICMIAYKVGAVDVSQFAGGYSLIKMLPYLLVIILAILGMNVFFVLVIGSILSFIIAVAGGSYGFLEALSVYYNGIMGMEDVSMWALYVGGMIGLMRYLGGLDFLVYRITKSIKSKKGAEFACLFVTVACGVCITNNTLICLTAAPICKEISDRYGLERKRIASIVDIFASVVGGLVPYGGFCLFAAGITEGAVSAIQVTPYVWYCIAMAIVAVVAVATGYPRFGKSRA